ncbi:hypothetical protein [Streptomyces sp. NPDC101455]|uniref:hypothetical protein n=1 Tax=Streptomyces sp. NPDC101455 TaxID=3366142 RepID=UPI003813C268
MPANRGGQVGGPGLVGVEAGDGVDPLTGLITYAAHNCAAVTTTRGALLALGAAGGRTDAGRPACLSTR